MVPSAVKNWAVFLIAGLATLYGATLYFESTGQTDVAFDQVLEFTGRLAFLVFLVIFAARPLRQRNPSGFTTALLKQRRLIGVAFAGIHFAHLWIIVSRQQLDPAFGFPNAGNIPGAIAYGFILLMFITSFNSTTRALGPKRWRLLHTAGLYYLFVIFELAVMRDFVEYFKTHSSIDWPALAVIAAAVAALAIRISAYQKKRAAS